MLARLTQTLLKPFTRTSKAAAPSDDGPRIISRDEHAISRANISEHALKVLYRLKKGGYEAYLVGGGVRDMLLGREPKDFDIATDASPEEVKRLFRNCRLIGRRFRLAHVFFGREIIEVATFRAPHDSGDGEGRSENGMLVRDNVYGSLEDDAWRRDLTVNALYYNIRDFSVVDYTGGMEDLKAGRLRIIGDPEQRFREDPVRMLRVVRFAAKLGFRIDPKVEEQIYQWAHLLEEIPPARLFDEVLKLLMGGYAVETFELLRHYHLFEQLFPDTDEYLNHEEQGFPLTFISKALENTDIRIEEDKPVTPAFLFATLLWEPVRHRAALLEQEGEHSLQALHQAGDEVVRNLAQRIAFPKRFSLQSREIWSFQARLEKRQGKRPARLMEHPRFRAAYDFLVLRSETGEAEPELAEWWRQYQEADEGARRSMTQAERPRGWRGRGRGRGRRRGGSRTSSGE